MSKWRKADDKEVTAKQDQFQAVEEAFNESFAKLRAKHKIVVGNEDDAADLCDLVRLKYWKVKLLVHDSTLGPVKSLIWVEAQKGGLYSTHIRDLTGPGVESCTNSLTFQYFNLTKLHKSTASSSFPTTILCSALSLAKDSLKASSTA
ncbi:unnamed protein product [Prunus armeniaca]|uniref:Uncharacterized protein n=1 Tax=Prunus armeniaca TaxID=36596 RepID=A0A6J5Y1M1_PRUAR|nr:unnamed protein product [Prunus armeniaca]